MEKENTKCGFPAQWAEPSLRIQQTAVQGQWEFQLLWASPLNSLQITTNDKASAPSPAVHLGDSENTLLLASP